MEVVGEDHDNEEVSYLHILDGCSEQTHWEGVNHMHIQLQ